LYQAYCGIGICNVCNNEMYGTVQRNMLPMNRSWHTVVCAL